MTQPLTGRQFFDLVQGGARPVLVFSDNSLEGPDVGFMGVVVSVRPEESYFAVDVNFKPYEERNKAIAPRDWYDKAGVPCLTWMESPHYPTSGVASFYLEFDNEMSFTLGEENEIFKMYLENTEGMNYVDWLESFLRRLLK